MLIYLINTFSKKLFHHKKTIFAYALMVVIPLTLVYEGYGYHKFVSSEIIKSPNLFDIKQTSQTFSNNIKTIKPQHYQAILSFPFFYIGSGNFGIEADERIYQLSFLYSYHLKLPFINGFLARSSIPESKKIMQLLASNFYYKNYQKDLPNKKPFLLICLNNKMNAAENNYVQKATLLSKNNEYSIYEINPEVFLKIPLPKNLNYSKIIKII